MKKEYLEELERLLDENAVKGKEEILAKYEKRYDFGLESELSETEIEEMLGTPEDVCKKFQKEEPEEIRVFKVYDEQKASYKKGYNLVVKTVGDDIVLVKSDDDLVHLEFDDIDLDSYTIKNDTEEGVYVNYMKKKFFGLNRRRSGKITIKVPEGKAFDKVEITTTSGDHKINVLEGNQVLFSTVSGDVLIHNVKCNTFDANTVSGDFDVNYVKADKVAINTVSGDLEFEKVEANRILIDSVSGDVDIDETNCESISANSVSGDLKINGNEHRSLTKSMKEMFK